LVEQDIPTYSVSGSETWSIDEFHYQDVVEITYTASQQTTKSVFSASRLRQREPKPPAVTQRGEEQIEGFLVLSLVNGVVKQYPTTKNSAQGFLSVARGKVREAKARRI
jgi:hypothetical protein